jgi:NAD(P)-dependent dehydrogenase (short-subunit alcohol dehydrogenase family)
MILKDRVAVVYGGGGAIGGAVARRFAREGAAVYLAGRRRTKLEVLAGEIAAAGGRAHAAVVDALDEQQVERHVAAICAESGRLDIAFNAVGHVHVQGKPLSELTLAEFEAPIHAYARSQFAIAKAASRPMLEQRSGVLLSLSTPAARRGFAGVLGFGATCAAIEALTRHLACELGPRGVRVVCLRPDAVPETLSFGSHAREVFQPIADRAGMTLDQMLHPSTSASVLMRYPRLEEVASAAAFAASEHAGAMTGAILNLTCGSVFD